MTKLKIFRGKEGSNVCDTTNLKGGIANVCRNYD